MTTLFISDLHLQPEREDITRAFEGFMQREAQAADALYILGDFFEVWVGDDDDAPFNQRIADTLTTFSNSGRPLYLMSGNRDFLMGEAWAQRCGATLLGETEAISLHGTDTLLLHGDSLCTRDEPYMAFRQMARSPAWQAELLGKSLEERRMIARQLRQQSKSMSSMKAEDIMDVTPAEVVALLEQHHCQRMIHGHTHRPARHSLEANGANAERIVLGDWDTHGWWLQADNDGGLQLLNKPLAELQA